MPDGLYEQDIYSWAEQQSDLLRRLAAGEWVNEAVDWANVIEEVQDVGLSELRSCRSFLRNALAHLLKLHAWPDSLSASAWRSEVDRFAADALDRFSPSMRRLIDLEQLYRQARRRVAIADDASGAPRPIPEDCPFTLDALLEGEADALLPMLAIAPIRD